MCTFEDPRVDVEGGAGAEGGDESGGESGSKSRDGVGGEHGREESGVVVNGGS